MTPSAPQAGPAPAFQSPDAAERRHRQFAWALGITLFVTHGWALLAFGATFWIDSRVFATFGAALRSVEEFRAIWDATGTFVYSHIGLGVPAIWAALSILPVAWQWPALALGQHALAIFAVALAFLTAHRLWPSWLHLAGATLLSLHPFYQSLHNALLTESITSSLLLCGIALTLRLLFAPASGRRDFFLLLLCAMLLIQVRSYNGAVLIAMAAVALWKRRDAFPRIAWVWLAVAFLAGNAFLPTIRWMVTGRWLAPGLGTNRLVFATCANPTPSPALRDRIRALGWLPEETITALLTRSFEYTKARGIAVTWQREGLSYQEISARLGTLVSMIESDRPDILLTKVRCGLVSSGWTQLGFAGPASGPVYQHRTLAELREQKTEHVRWLSWVTKPSHRKEGEDFFLHMSIDLNHSVEAQRALWAALRNYISERPIAWRDPLRLASLPPDVWATIGLLAIGLCFWRRPALGIVLILPFAVNFAVTAIGSLAGSRYCYPLLPVAVLATTIAWALVTRRGISTAGS